MRDRHGDAPGEPAYWLRAARLRKMAAKAGEGLAGRVREAPRWQGRPEARRHVAQALLGGPGDARLRRTLEGGSDNLGVALFEAVDPAGIPAGPRFVEKIARDRTDFRVATLLAGTDGSCVVPRVHGTCAGADGYAIYMEWWPEAAIVGAAPPTDLPDPLHLARAVHRLSRDLAPLVRDPVFPGGAAYFNVLATRFRAHLHDAAGIAPARFERALAAVSALPRAIGHDDLNVENIVARQVAPGIGVGLIDVGAIRVNAEGSSFQRLALSAVTDGDSGPLREAAAEYARLSGLDTRQILFAANLYAASRRLNRNVNKLESDPFGVPAQLFDEALRHL